MRALGLAIATALTLVAGSAAADDTVPTKREVHQAEAAAQAKGRDVAAVQADLVLANQRLQASAVEAAQAAEAWNGARYRLEQAQQAAAAAEQRSAAATADVERLREAYGDTVAASYQQAPELTALNAIAGSDGIDGVIDQVTTMRNAETALDANYDSSAPPRRWPTSRRSRRRCPVRRSRPRARGERGAGPGPGGRRLRGRVGGRDRRGEGRPDP